MATIVNLPADPRITTLEQGVAGGVENFFTERRKKKLLQKYDQAFDMINKAATREDAIKQLGSVDPEILADEKALQQLGSQIDRRFPEQETLEVVNPETGQTEVITHEKGRPPSDRELLTSGRVRPETAGVGTFFIYDEETGDVAVADKTNRTTAEKKYPGKLVVSQEEVGSTASLKNAFANILSAKAQEKAANAREPKTPTEFDQTVDAVADRLSLDISNPQDRNKAINVVKFGDTARKSYDTLVSKKIGDQILLTSSDIAGAKAIGAELIEPILVDGGSPDTASKSAYAAMSYIILNDSRVRKFFDIETRARLASDFTDITGFIAGDAILNKAIASISEQAKDYPDGVTLSTDVLDENGKDIGDLVVVKINGRIIPVSGHSTR